LKTGFERTDLRIDFPPGYLKTMAIWLRPVGRYLRASLESLGQPDFRMQNGVGDALSIVDISCKGAMLRVESPPCEMQIDTATIGVFLYLQLYDPWCTEAQQRLSLFFYCRIAMARREEGALCVGVEFLRRGIGSKLEKSLDFLNVEKYGVDDLMRWCNDILRQQLPQAAPPQRGLDLDCLLEELDNAHNNADGAAACPLLT
jgi:hypothetical protein